MKPFVSKFLIGLAVFALWFTVTLMGWMGYAALSITLNGGHPWPYEPGLFFGVIPAGIGGFFALGIYGVWRIVKKRRR